MAAPARNFREVRKLLGQVKKRPASRRPDLLAFLLFDERQSHRIIQEFAREEFDWLDGLATAARMVLFFFLPGHPRIPEQPASSQPTQVVVAESGNEVRNPSLEVAARFGLSAKDLPGVVFFTGLDLDSPGPHTGVYCPLSIDLFDDRRKAEDKLASLFGLVQRARVGAQLEAAFFTGGEPSSGLRPKEGEFAELLLRELRSLVDAEKRKAKAAPFLDALRTGVISLIKFPGKLAEVTAMAFGQELGKRTAQGAS